MVEAKCEKFTQFLRLCGNLFLLLFLFCRILVLLFIVYSYVARKYEAHIWESEKGKESQSRKENPFPMESRSNDCSQQLSR